MHDHQHRPAGTNATHPDPTRLRPHATPPTPEPPEPNPVVDISVRKTAAPSTVSVGGRITWVITVTNLSSNAAEDVEAFKLESLLSPKLELISVTTSRGTCDPTGCRLGTLPGRASARITVVTKAVATGVAVNIIQVTTTSPETNLANNTDSALARITGQLRPPVAAACRYVTVQPGSLPAKRTSVLLARATDPSGHRVRGLALEARGAGQVRHARTDSTGVARFVLTPSRQGNLFINQPGRATATAGTRPCAVALAVLSATTPPPPLTG